MLVFVALGAALIARVPLDKSPDESAHWLYIEYLVANRSLPVFEGQPPPKLGYEFHQPPLYYALAAPGWAVLPADVENYWARAVSLLCGALTLIFVWKSARLLLPADRSLATLATAFAALWPLHMSVSAGSNNDAMAGLWAAALFWCGARVTIQGSTARDAALMGLFIGLGALTKNTVLVVGALALAALLWARPAAKAPSRAVNLLIALAVTTVIAMPWWARNTLLYGDPLVLRLFAQAAALGTPGLAQMGDVGTFFQFAYWRGMFWLIFLTAWGFFGGVNSAVTATAPFSLDGPVLRPSWLWPLVASFALASLSSLAGWRQLRIADEIELAPAQKRVLWIWLLGFALVFVAWLQFAYGHFSGGQARYLHAALLPMCVLGALGWRAVWGNGPRPNHRLVDAGRPDVDDDAAQLAEVENSGLNREQNTDFTPARGRNAGHRAFALRDRNPRDALC